MEAIARAGHARVPSLGPEAEQVAHTLADEGDALRSVVLHRGGEYDAGGERIRPGQPEDAPGYRVRHVAREVARLVDIAADVETQVEDEVRGAARRELVAYALHESLDVLAARVGGRVRTELHIERVERHELHRPERFVLVAQVQRRRRAVDGGAPPEFPLGFVRASRPQSRRRGARRGLRARHEGHAYVEHAAIRPAHVQAQALRVLRDADGVQHAAQLDQPHPVPSQVVVAAAHVRPQSRE